MLPLALASVKGQLPYGRWDQQQAVEFLPLPVFPTEPRSASHVCPGQTDISVAAFWAHPVMDFWTFTRTRILRHHSRVRKLGRKTHRAGTSSPSGPRREDVRTTLLEAAK